MFLGVGISYLMMGSIYFLRNKLDLNTDIFNKKIYLSLFVTGFVIILISITNFIFDNLTFAYSLFALTMFGFLFYVYKSYENYIIANEVMEELNKNE